MTFIKYKISDGSIIFLLVVKKGYFPKSEDIRREIDESITVFSEDLENINPSFYYFDINSGEIKDKLAGIPIAKEDKDLAKKEGII